MVRSHAVVVTALSGFALLAACTGPSEPPRVTLPVVATVAAGSSTDTSLGYQVRLQAGRVAARDMSFYVDGDAHVAATHTWFDALVAGRARAHPGHLQGGVVTGVLAGAFVLGFEPESDVYVGEAVLLAGDYASASMVLDRGGAAHGLAPDDALFGHTAILRGVAERGASTVDFEVVVDSPEGRVLEGIPFAVRVGAQSTGPIAVELRLDALEGTTSLFDDVDFLALDDDADGTIRLHGGSPDGPSLDAYFSVRLAFQTHDVWNVVDRTAR